MVCASFNKKMLILIQLATPCTKVFEDDISSQQQPSQYVDTDVNDSRRQLVD